MIRDVYPGSGFFPIPDPDPGSRGQKSTNNWILLSWSKKSEKNFVSYCFVTTLRLFIFDKCGSNLLRYLLLVTWRDKTSPPCRRIAVTSGIIVVRQCPPCCLFLISLWLSTCCELTLSALHFTITHSFRSCCPFESYLFYFSQLF